MTKLDHTHLLHLQLQEYLLVYEFHCLLASVCDLDIFLLASVSVCDLVIFPVFHICTLCWDCQNTEQFPIGYLIFAVLTEHALIQLSCLTSYAEVPEEVDLTPTLAAACKA